MWSDNEFLIMSQASRYGSHLDALIPKWRALADAALATEPTVFHKLVAERGWSVVTQNVDGLHQRAGSQHVVEVHGSILEWRRMRKPKGDFPLEELPEETRGMKVRPNMVLFGERLLQGRQALELVQRADVVAFVGTSGNVFPVAGWPVESKRAILVDPKPWEDMEGFSAHLPLTSDEWALAGFPLAE